MLYFYVTGILMFAELSWKSTHTKFTSLSFCFCSPPGGLNFIDHIVGNQPDDEMVPVSDWYDSCLRTRTHRAARADTGLKNK